MSYYQRQNCLQLGKINSLPIKLDLDSEKQWEHSNTFPPPSALHSWLPYPLMGVVQRDGDRGLWLFHNNTSLPLLPPHTLSLIHRRVFSTGCHCCRRYASALVGYRADLYPGTRGTSSPFSFLHHLGAGRALSPIFFCISPPPPPTQCCQYGWQAVHCGGAVEEHSGTFRNFPELSSPQRPHIE